MPHITITYTGHCNTCGASYTADTREVAWALATVCERQLDRFGYRKGQEIFVRAEIDRRSGDPIHIRAKILKVAYKEKTHLPLYYVEDISEGAIPETSFWTDANYVNNLGIDSKSE